MKRAILADVIIALIIGSCIPATGGCSAQHWMGTGVNQPSTEFQGPSLFAGPKVKVTSDAQASVDELSYSGPASGTDKPSTFTMKGAKFGQTPSTSLPLLPALVTAASEGQRTQTEYAKVWADTITSIAGDAFDFFSLAKIAGVKQTSSGLQLTLPGGFSIGGQKVNTPADFSKALQSVQDAIATLRAKPPITTQPSSQ